MVHLVNETRPCLWITRLLPFYAIFQAIYKCVSTVMVKKASNKLRRFVTALLLLLKVKFPWFLDFPIIMARKSIKEEAREVLVICSERSWSWNFTIQPVEINCWFLRSTIPGGFSYPSPHIWARIAEVVEVADWSFW